MTLLRAALCVACLVLVGGVAWHGFVVERADDDERRRVRLETLRAHVGNVDNLAMRAGYGLLPSYDPLVRSLDALRKHVRALANDAKGSADEAEFLVLLDRVEERTRHVEELKSLRSALSNSERFLRDRLGDEGSQSAVVTKLEQLLLAQRLVPDDERNLDALHAMRPALAADERGARLLPHVDVVLDARRRLTDLTGRLLQLQDSLAARAAERTTAHQAVLEAHRQEANRGRLAALSLALLVVTGALWLPERRRP